MVPAKGKGSAPAQHSAEGKQTLLQDGLPHLPQPKEIILHFSF